MFSKKENIRDSENLQQRKSFFYIQGDTMKIYITDLAAYNAGHLIGEWVSLPMESEDLQAKITEILATGAKVCDDNEHEEIFTTDYECFMCINEYDSIEKLNAIAEAVEGLDENELKAIRFLMDNNLVNGFEEAIECYEDVIIHENMTMEDIAYDFINECYGVDSLPSIIANNIDYEKIGRELEMDGRYFENGGDIYEYIG